LEKKIETLENSLKEKDSLLNIAEGSLAKARLRSEKQSIQISDQNARIEELNKELEKTKSTLQDSTNRFNREAEVLNLKVKAKAKKNFKLSEALKTLQDKCFSFATQCSSRLRRIFNSVGATSEEANHSAEDIPKALEWIEREIDDHDEVIVGHGDFCALVPARGTTASFAKVGCNHLKVVNKPTFSLSPSDLDNIPAKARSIGNIFITQIWTKDGQEAPEDEARALINKV
jgi:predicted nuclease with TOPRIM domain